MSKEEAMLINQANLIKQPRTDCRIDDVIVQHMIMVSPILISKIAEKYENEERFSVMNGPSVHRYWKGVDHIMIAKSRKMKTGFSVVTVDGTIKDDFNEDTARFFADHLFYELEAIYDEQLMNGCLVAVYTPFYPALQYTPPEYSELVRIGFITRLGYQKINSDHAKEDIMRWNIQYGPDHV